MNEKRTAASVVAAVFVLSTATAAQAAITTVTRDASGATALANAMLADPSS